jgi:hypothetical protein
MTGFPWDALEAARGLSSTAADITALSRDFGPDAARWAIGQWKLRAKAKEKFRRAEEMLFDREALEMATHEDVAAWRASLFPEGAEVLDATCGIGADAIALAGRGPTRASDLDPERAAMTAHNLAVHGRKAEVQTADASDAMGGQDYVLLDPQRRSAGKRLAPEDFFPSPWQLDLSEKRMAVIKLSPMTPDPMLDALGPEVLFVSFRGECREAVVRCGRESQPCRSALLLPKQIEWPATADPVVTDRPDAFMFDPDPAIQRAGALGHWGLKALATARGWLTGPALQSGPWKSYETLWHGGFHPKNIQTEIRARQGHVDVVKTRGAPHDPAIVRRRFRPEGEAQFTLMLYRHGPKIQAILARALASP